MNFEVLATDGNARTGLITTPRGMVHTPCFMPVGTRAAVRTLSTDDLESLGSEIILGNTYHLMLRPGADLVAARGGLHDFMDWRGFVLTDSGGYQIFSLEPKVDDEGAVFRSTYDGSTHKLTPELAVEIQIALGADIQMVLDVCPPLPSPDNVVRAAEERTAVWARRARTHFLERAEGDPLRSQFGIVQGASIWLCAGSRRPGSWKSASRATPLAASLWARNGPRCSNPSRRPQRPSPTIDPAI